jgi:hypothetical protein
VPHAAPHVAKGAPVVASDIALRHQRSKSPARRLQLRSLLLFFAFWIFAAGFFLFVYMDRLT